MGAILTQNTAWSNVEQAIANLKAENILNAPAIAQANHDVLAVSLRPSGYFNIKAHRLQNFCRWYLEQGELRKLQLLGDGELRHGLLSVNGVGPETADDMMLYAFERQVFVIDAYTRRIFSRLAIIQGQEGYEHLRSFFEEGLAHERQTLKLFNEYHALIVIHAKEHCRSKPRCSGCCIRAHCHYPQ